MYLKEKDIWPSEEIQKIYRKHENLAHFQQNSIEINTGNNIEDMINVFTQDIIF